MTHVARGYRADISDEMLLQSFNRIDTDKSGRLDKLEMMVYTAELGWELTAEEVDGAMEHMEQDGNGTVAYASFIEWWRSDDNSEIAKKLKQKILRQAKKLSSEAAEGAEKSRVVQLEQQLEFTRGELHVEKQRAEKLQARVKSISRMEDDVLLLTSAPLKSGGGKTTMEELEIANKQLSEKNLKIAQLEKRELQDALSKDATKRKVLDLQEALQASKVQVRKQQQQQQQQ